MRSIFVILLAMVMTTQLLEARHQPKVLVYEVSERDGAEPEIQLLNVEDINVPLDYGDVFNDLTLKSTKNNKNRHGYSSNRQSVQSLDQLLGKYKERNNLKSQNDYKSHLKAYSKLNNYKLKKNKNSYRNRDLENIFIDWDKQQSYRDDQSEKNDYAQQQIQQNDKQSVRNYVKKQKNNFDDDYADFELERRAPEDVLLAQLLKPLKRQKREAERTSIIQKLKHLLKRLRELDDDGEANVEGTVYINKQHDANDWDLESNILGSNYKKNAIEINRVPTLRSGNQQEADQADDDKLDVLGDDRTMPPPPRGRYEPDY